MMRHSIGIAKLKSVILVINSRLLQASTKLANWRSVITLVPVVEVVSFAAPVVSLRRYGARTRRHRLRPSKRVTV